MSKLALRLNSKFPLDKTQPIFMGIDVHKKTLSISLVHQNVLIGQFTIAYDTEALKNLLNRYTDFKIFSVYEAGFSGFHLHFFLESIKVHNIITPPNKMPTVIGDRVKTDKKDSPGVNYRPAARPFGLPGRPPTGFPHDVSQTHPPPTANSRLHPERHCAHRSTTHTR